MKRKIMKDLLKWKEDNNRKPLLLTGIRQCGKTYIIKEFASEYFESSVYINFEKEESAAEIFEHDLDPKRIINEISILLKREKITPGKTLLILDEIQACPKAITSLKYFCEELNELHVVAAGSLLGVAIKRLEISFPVGKVDHLNMYPLSFDEFVEANDAKNLMELIKGRAMEEPVPQSVSKQLERLLKEYYIVGGMPEVVQSWIDEKDIDKVDELQKTILDNYRNDFAKHAPIDTVPKLTLIWDSIPVQLGKDNNKFMFSHVKKGARAREFEDALQWLVDAGLVLKPLMIEKPSVPLSICADTSYFKVYLADVGLMRQKAGVYYRNLLDDFSEYTPFKGSLSENYIFCELVNQDLPTWFYRSGSGSEVDVLTEYKGLMIPIEVKSADNTMAKSYRDFCCRFKPRIGLKMSLKNIAINKIDDTVSVSLPLYLSGRIKEYIEATILGKISN